MGSNPPIKAIPASVAEPNKHIAAYLRSVRPFSVEFASRGVEYFHRSRAAGDVLREEDCKRDYYDTPSSCRQRRPQLATSGHHLQHHHHHHHHHHSPAAVAEPAAGTASPASIKREALGLGRPGPLPTSRRYSATRAAPYARRSVDMYAPSSYNTCTDKPPGTKTAETRERDSIDSDAFGRHLHNALHRTTTMPTKRMPVLPISPPPEVANRRDSLRLSIPGRTGGAANSPPGAAVATPGGGSGIKLDALQVAIQRPSRLSFARSGILARGAMSQPVKVSPSHHFEIDPVQDMAAIPQTYLDATSLHRRPPQHHPGSLRMPSYSPASPYSAENAAHSRTVPWSPWASAPYDSPVSHQHTHLSGRHGMAAHWIDEIGALYGLGGGCEELPYSWYIEPQEAFSPIAVDVERKRFGRPVSAPLPEAMYDVIPESAMFDYYRNAAYHRNTHGAANSPSMVDIDPLSPVAAASGGGGAGAGMWGPRSDSPHAVARDTHLHNRDWPMPPPVHTHTHGYSWPSNDPVTPVSPSDEVMTFGWGPHSAGTLNANAKSATSQKPYAWHSTADCANRVSSGAGADADVKPKPSLPALHTLSLQTPSPYSPYYPSPSDYGREAHAQPLF